MRFCLLVMFAWLTSSLSTAAQDWTGHWVWSVEDKSAMVLRLDASGHGEISRPRHLTMDANAGYWRMVDASSDVTTIAVTPLDRGDRIIMLRTVDAEGSQTTDYRLAVTGPNEAELAVSDIPASMPFSLRRAVTPTTVATDWVSGRAYGKPPIFPDNAELTQLFADDQAARQGTITSALGVVRQDAERRVTVRRMLDAGQVRSAADHYHAAYIFQHGRDPDDYLLAHALAVAAIARGRDDAAWISAATLDRFLQSIERPQIYGTQYTFKNPSSGSVTQGDYDRLLLPDGLRTVVGVPPLAAQTQMAREMGQAD